MGGSFVHCQTELWSHALAGDCGRSHKGLALRSPSPVQHTSHTWRELGATLSQARGWDPVSGKSSEPSSDAWGPLSGWACVGDSGSG